MVGSSEKLLELLSQQKELTGKYEEIIQEINRDKNHKDIESLSKQVEILEKKVQEWEKNHAKVVEKNLVLKNALREQMVNEKTAILNASKRKIHTYFDSLEKAEENKLMRLEKVAKNRIARAMNVAKEELRAESTEISSKLKDIEGEIQVSIQKRKELLQAEKKSILEDMKAEYETLDKEPLDEKVLEKKQKENDIEVKIGLNVLNKIGIILLLLAVATGMKYTFSNWLGTYAKSVIGFVFAVFLLGMGEWLNRKEKNVFALGLCGAGIGVFYLSVFSSYFILHTINLVVAMWISLVVTGISVVLAKRYESQTITAASLIGGYLPFFSYVFAQGLQEQGIYIAMGYLFVLNATILILSMEKRWSSIKYLSFFFNIVTSVYLMEALNRDVLSLFYTIGIFVMYLGIVLYKPLREKLSLKKAEIVLLTLNTISNFGILYYLFKSLQWEDFIGFLSLVYGISYYLLAKYIAKKSEGMRKSADLFYLTSLTFAVLMIPFQFGMEWLSLGWLVEAALLLYISQTKYKQEKKIEKAGWGILLLCVGAFLFLDFYATWQDYFIFKYTSMTVVLAFVLRLYLPEITLYTAFEKSNRKSALYIYKYFVILFAWSFLGRMSNILYRDFIDKEFLYGAFFEPILYALATGVSAYAISHIKSLEDKGSKIIANGMYILLALICLGMNASGVTITESPSLRIVAVGILLVYNVFVFFALKHLVLQLISYRHLTLEIFPLAMALYTMGVIPLFLMNQFDLSNIQLIISIVFVALSFVYIVYGFKKKYMLIRRLGLFLSIVSTGKLFILDLHFLSTVGKIVAYLSFGVTLLGISFIYQKLKAMTEEEKE